MCSTWLSLLDAETSSLARNPKSSVLMTKTSAKRRNQEDRMRPTHAIRLGLLSIAALAMTATLALAQAHISKPFSGAKVNGGTVTHSMKDGKDVLTLSDDFKV